MRYLAGMMILLMLLSAPVFAANADDKAARKELRELNQQIKAAMQKVKTDENVRGLKKQMRTTKAAYAAACKNASENSPGLQEIDKKIADLKKQRDDLINKDEAVAAPKTAYDDALGAYIKAVNELAGVDIAELKKKRNELRQKMTPRPKKDRAGKKPKKNIEKQPAEERIDQPFEQPFDVE